MLLLLQNEDDDLYKRDFSAPTLEDHFNKTILPKVMQVSCFSSVFVIVGNIHLEKLIEPAWTTGVSI